MMPVPKLLAAIGVMVCVTFLTRALPFLLFDKKDVEPPKWVLYLGNYLPPALICTIIVYCFKDLYIFTGLNIQNFLADYREFIALAVVLFLHLWKKNTMVSIFVGTAVYMFLVQTM